MSLHPDFPIIEGRYRLTEEWELHLPDKFNRRVEDGSLVLWRPGLTFWISVWGSLPQATPEGALSWMLRDASPERTDEKIERSGDVIRLSYRLREQRPDGTPQALASINACVIAPAGLLVIAAYCDSPEAESTGGEVIASVRPTGGGAAVP
jgi:hypothetical protein